MVMVPLTEFRKGDGIQNLTTCCYHFSVKNLSRYFVVSAQDPKVIVILNEEKKKWQRVALMPLMMVTFVVIKDEEERKDRMAK